MSLTRVAIENRRASVRYTVVKGRKVVAGTVREATGGYE